MGCTVYTILLKVSTKAFHHHFPPCNSIWRRKCEISEGPKYYRDRQILHRIDRETLRKRFLFVLKITKIPLTKSFTSLNFLHAKFHFLSFEIKMKQKIRMICYHPSCQLWKKYNVDSPTSRVLWCNLWWVPFQIFFEKHGFQWRVQPRSHLDSTLE